MGNNLSLSLEIQDDVVNRINNYINALKKTLSTQLKKAPTLYHYTKLRKAFCLNPEANVSDQIHDEECIALFSEICKYHQANFLQEQCSIVFQLHSVNRKIRINKNSSISQTAVQILRSKIKLHSKVSQIFTASTSENFMTSKYIAGKTHNVSIPLGTSHAFTSQLPDSPPPTPPQPLPNLSILVSEMGPNQLSLLI